MVKNELAFWDGDDSGWDWSITWETLIKVISYLEGMVIGTQNLSGVVNVDQDLEGMVIGTQDLGGRVG